MTKKISFFFFMVLVLLMGCKNNASKLVYFVGFTQGGPFQIKFYAGKDSTDIMNGIDSLMNVINTTASVFDSSSIISKVNANQDVVLNEHFIKLFNKSLEVSKASQGCFDITVGPLVRAWGFWQKKGIDLTQKQVDSIKNFVGYKNIILANSKVVKQHTESMLDFNAIAQGYTVDVISGYLINHNCNDFLIEIGGEVRAHGYKNEKDNWIIGIEKPAADADANQEIQEKIALKNKAIATSGNYRKYFIKNEKKYSHTIDPFTGFPVKHSLLSVTVLADDCTTADAYGTAFMVMGLEKSKAFLRTHTKLDAYFIYSDTLGNFITEYTKGFESLIVK